MIGRRTRIALVALAVVLVTGGIGRFVLERRLHGYSDTHGVGVVRYTLTSERLGTSLEEIALIPPGRARRPLLVLLHGRRRPPSVRNPLAWLMPHQTGPESLLSDPLFEALAGLGDRAPVIVLLNGGTHNYYHDRRTGMWGSMMLAEAIPDAERRFHTAVGQTAIGGISMGGFGALYLAGQRPPRFCAVGAHSAALWLNSRETPPGAFDDAEDYRRNDVWALARRGSYDGLPVWLDVGAGDRFHDADVAFAKLLASRGVAVSAHVWPGGHDRAYWHSHLRAKLRFYADALARCETRSAS